MANSAFEAALNWALRGRTPWRKQAVGQNNIYDITLHPNGLRQFMVNPEHIIPHTLRRLRAAAQRDEGAKKVLRRAEIAYGLDAFLAIPESDMSAASSVLVERYLVHNRGFNLISIIASFGSPEDVTAESLQIELFLADESITRKHLAALR
jgi:hypothetical protein